MITKITDDFYIDLDALYVLVKEDDKYYYATQLFKSAISIPEELYLAMKNKIDEMSNKAEIKESQCCSVSDVILD